MTPFIETAISERTLGLALHYPLLHAAVVGLGAKRTLEFGAGGSTRVILEALAPSGHHVSISAETQADLEARHFRESIASPSAVWTHHHGKSKGLRGISVEPVDLVLHDGSHAADVVAADIAWIWPHLKTFGLLLIHDSQHLYCGAEVREGIKRGLIEACANYSMTTLPYGFGLTIVRKEKGGPGQIEPATAKAGSAHRTEPVPVDLD